MNECMNRNTPVHAHCAIVDYAQRVEFFIEYGLFDVDGGRIWRLKSEFVEVTGIDRNHPFPPPSFELNMPGAQALMDALYRAGFRPSRTDTSAGQVDAMQLHLNDFRALLANFIGMNFDGKALLPKAPDRVEGDVRIDLIPGASR
jgi:hypothetical protein